jgi:hypothetical protein
MLRRSNSRPLRFEILKGRSSMPQDSLVTPAQFAGGLADGAVLGIMLVVVTHLLRRYVRPILFVALLAAALAYVGFALNARAGATWVLIDDPRVDVKRVGGFSAEPSGISSTDSESFRMLERTIRSVAPEAMVAPYLVVVVTDARHYRELSSNVFRFMPIQLTPRDLERMHGTNERIAVRGYERAIRLYRQLILNATGSSTTSAGPASR